MSDLLVLGNGVAKPASPEPAVGSELEKSEALSREASPNPMYGQRHSFVGEEEMKDKFISVGVCAMDAKVSRL